MLFSIKAIGQRAEIRDNFPTHKTPTIVNQSGPLLHISTNDSLEIAKQKLIRQNRKIFIEYYQIGELLKLSTKRDSVQPITINYTFKIGTIEMSDGVAKEYFRYCLSQRDTVMAVGVMPCVPCKTDEERKMNIDYMIGGKHKFYYLVQQQPSEIGFMQWYLKR